MPRNRPSRVRKTFEKVRAFVAKKDPAVARRASFRDDCKLAKLENERFGRVYMHTFHRGKSVICTWGAYAEKLSKPYLVGILLHEFGHVARGTSEIDADFWVFSVLGIPIEYKGSQCLEWVEPYVLEEIGL